MPCTARPSFIWGCGCLSCLQYRSYLVRSGDSSPKYGVEDIYDAMSSAAVINIHAYGESGDAQLEVK